MKTLVSEADWIEVEPGRAAILRLNGPSGSIDLAVVQLATGDASRDRVLTMERLAGQLRPPDSSLTVHSKTLQRDLLEHSRDHPGTF